jgi:hypothetical protein
MTQLQKRREQRRADDARWYEAHREEVLARRKRYYQENRERINQERKKRDEWFRRAAKFSVALDRFSHSSGSSIEDDSRIIGTMLFEPRR